MVLCGSKYIVMHDHKYIVLWNCKYMLLWGFASSLGQQAPDHSLT